MEGRGRERRSPNHLDGLVVPSVLGPLDERIVPRERRLHVELVDELHPDGMVRAVLQRHVRLLCRPHVDEPEAERRQRYDGRPCERGTRDELGVLYELGDDVNRGAQLGGACLLENGPPLAPSGECLHLARQQRRAGQCWLHLVPVAVEQDVLRAVAARGVKVEGADLEASVAGQPRVRGDDGCEPRVGRLETNHLDRELESRARRDGLAKRHARKTEADPQHRRHKADAAAHHRV
mmetsp:Transcript_16886/g.38623  ORF Transcript_16886/g.38623 Transcript_16886/m.38623 type:complete len:236 (+) Transcript_16886:1451-2158(+)